MKVPSFMLKKLFVNGSLEPRDEGFAFKLKNTLATATLIGAPELYIDGTAVDQDDIVFHVGDQEIAGPSIDAEEPFELSKGSEVQVTAAAPDIEAGAHKLRIKVATKEWDTLDFSVEDTA